MAAYYNENDLKIAAWLRELIKARLIADGEVDTRSIADVQPSDLVGFAQCHFFAGTGAWSLALRRAGWADWWPAWTFSCPCQFKSSASRGRAVAADMWPEQRRLLVASCPGVFFGEQVAAAGDWFDGLCADVEAVGYDIGAAILPAVAVGADHARPRIYFVGDAHRDGEPVMSIDGKVARLLRHHRDAGELVQADGLSARMVAMSGFGNAIHVELAAEFIGAYMDICSHD